MKRIVLPGYGTATTLIAHEDSSVSVLVNGKMVDLPLKAHQPTRIEYLEALDFGGLIAA